MTTVSLYALADLRDRLDDKLEVSEGELTPELEAELDALDGAIDEKIERVALFAKELMATAVAIEQEEKRLGALRRSKFTASESLRKYLQAQMERLGKKKVDGLLCAVSIQRNSSPSITLACTPEQIHAGEGGAVFVDRVESVDYRLRRDDVIAAWKSEKPLPAGVSVVQGLHVRIR